MTQREIARLACKVLAVWAFIDSLQHVARPLTSVIYALVSLFKEGSVRGGVASYTYLFVDVALSGLQLVLAVALWKRAGVVAAWMTGHTLQDEQDEPDP